MTKKSYSKPHVCRVDLRPEDSVLAACKTIDTGGGVCNGPGGPNEIGSAG